MSTHSNTKPTQALFATFITFFLLLLSKVNSSDDLSFQFKKFKPNGKDLIIQGNASVSEAGILRLTNVENGIPILWSVAKVEYAAPVHIWENDKVASFVTTFRFRMEKTTNIPADGFTFFLAPPDFPLGPKGGNFALFDDSKCNSSSSSSHVVAVEFDTYYDNPWDPKYQHIGIDVNCVASQKTVQWDSRYGGEVANVEIRYEASTKTLTTSLTYPSDQTSYIVSSKVDLKAILPEWVRVGFSATSGNANRETHDVLNWSFTSTFEADHNVALDNNARENNARFYA